jgi:hypothetical protein
MVNEKQLTQEIYVVDHSSGKVGFSDKWRPVVPENGYQLNRSMQHYLIS